MRKKYLSALLFGALLLASAGTFTSCSDYDDDIKNLQEQIDSVVSDLNSLKTKVDGLGGCVTDVKVENGKLLVTANGSTIAYDLPAGGSSEVANIEIKGGHLYVNGTDKGSVGSTVTVNEDGELVIDGEVSDLKVGTEVIIKDASNGMYTISIDGQTIQLPMASVAINYVKPTNGTVFSQEGTTSGESGTGIHWATASKDIEWKGALGNIAKGDLLVGGISKIGVEVSPATFDLGSSELTLVDSEGNNAEVTVSAISYSDAPQVGTRAASKDGKWILSVKPTDKATGDNMATLYTYEKKANLKYALAVDGRVVSDYQFIVDTWETAITNQSVAFDANKLFYKGEALKATKFVLPVGDCTLEYNQMNCADAYFTFEGTNVELAKQYGLEANGMTIKMTQEFAASRKTVEVVLHMLGIDGGVKDQKLVVSSNATTVDGAVEAEKTTYKVAYAADGNGFETIKIDLGNLITANMTNDEIEAVDPNRITFEIADDKGKTFIVAPTTIKAKTNLYVGDDKFTEDNSLAQVTSLQIPVAASSIQNDVETGSYTLVMTLKDGKGTDGNEIKKFNFPIDITLPSFDELFTKSTKWVDGKLTLKLNADQTSPRVNFNQAFEAADSEISLDKITYAIADIKDKEVLDSQNAGIVTLKNITTTDNTLVSNVLDVTASFKIADKAGLEVKSSFATNIKSVFEDATLVYYVNNTPQTVAKIGTDNYIAGLTGAGTNDSKYNGLAVKIGDYITPIKVNEVLDGITLSDGAGANKVVIPENADITGLSNVKAVIDRSSGNIEITTLQTNDKATMTIAFTDYSGIVVKRSIDIQK